MAKQFEKPHYQMLRVNLRNFAIVVKSSGLALCLVWRLTGMNRNVFLIGGITLMVIAWYILDLHYIAVLNTIEMAQHGVYPGDDDDDPS